MCSNIGIKYDLKNLLRVAETVGPMSYKETDAECGGCGATYAERKKNKPDSTHLGLSKCPHCGADKCCMCDMGDDVECGNCDTGDSQES